MDRRHIQLILICGLVAVIFGAFQSGIVSALMRGPGGGVWRLAFHDEFDAPTLDPSVWGTVLPWGDINSPELQRYVADAFEHQQGLLRIKAAQQPSGYTSGVLSTHAGFYQRYGYFEMRARLPAGNGYWPAFWLLSENREQPFEIDVFEYLGRTPDTIYMSNHWPGAAAERMEQTQLLTGVRWSEDFHVYAVEWNPAEIIWFVDGVERARIRAGVPQVPLHLIVSLSVGGDWPGNPDAATVFPGYLEIDYIRVYQRLGAFAARLPAGGGLPCRDAECSAIAPNQRAPDALAPGRWAARDRG